MLICTLGRPPLVRPIARERWRQSANGCAPRRQYSPGLWSTGMGCRRTRAPAPIPGRAPSMRSYVQQHRVHTQMSHFQLHRTTAAPGAAIVRGSSTRQPRAGAHDISVWSGKWEVGHRQERPSGEGEEERVRSTGRFCKRCDTLDLSGIFTQCQTTTHKSPPARARRRSCASLRATTPTVARTRPSRAGPRR